MRKKQLTYGAMAALMLTLGMTSCQNEMSEYTPSDGKHITFTATQEVAGVTRTYLNDNKIVVWSAGETVSLFDSESANCLFELVEGADRPVGEFDGTVSPNAREEYYAVYPYSEAYTFESGTATGVILPAEQTAVANGFDRNAAIMTGYTTNINCLPFKQLCAFVQVTTESASKKITFRSNGTENLAGTLDVEISTSGIGEATVTDNGSNMVSLVPATGSTSIAAGTYLIAVLPGTLEEGFTIEIDAVEGDDLTRSFENSTSVLKRAAVIDMGIASVAEGWTTTDLAANGYASVDLGITIDGKKLLFATCNVGASSPEEYGDYFAWGATEPLYKGYTMDGTSVNVTEWKEGKSDGYTEASAPFYSSGIGIAVIYTTYTTAGDVLAAEHDAARANMGGEWRMPTTEEMQALYDNTTNEPITDYKGTGIAGRIFTGKGNYANSSLFLPAAGYFDGTSCYSGGSYGRYWSSTLSSTYGRCLYFGSGSVVPKNYIGYRFYGFSGRAVRAVSE